MNADRKRSALWVLAVGLLSLFWTTDAFAQRITGKVTDAKGEGLFGAAVLVKGTSEGVVTEVDGTYAINVTFPNAVLVFSYVGFATREETIGTRTMVDVQLESSNDLETVIVVGYGTQRKADLTGAVSSVTSKDILAKPATSIDQVMAGRAPGVYIANRSGDPAAPIEVRIRGVGTAGNNKPLWVIDGVAVELTSNATVNTASFSESNPLAGINPSDIESIDVLKDASAAAIYGARAMNGVILVTTKRGKEGRTSATYDAYRGIQTIPQNRRLDVLNVSQYIALQKELGNDLSAFSGKSDFNWQDALFQTATVNNHNLSIRGGTKTFTFNIGGGWHSQGGVERGQEFERFSFKANSDIKVGKYLRFGESAIFSTTDRLVQSEGGNFAAAASLTNAPYFQPYDSNDPLGYTPLNSTTRGSGATATNYLWATDPRFNETRVKNRKVLGSFYGEFEPIAGLKLRSLFGSDFNVTDGFFWQEKTNADYGAGIRNSLLVQERPIELTTNWTNTLTYSKVVKGHSLTILAGYEEVNFRYDKVRLQGLNLFNSNIRFAAVASTVAGANEADHWALRSMFGRLNYAFKDKYLLQANLRRDQSSRFSPENRTGVFPSFSAGWRLSEESFFSGIKKSGAVDYLKIRASWGQLGNQYTGNNFGYLSSLAINSFYALGNRVVRGPAPIIFANADVHWETSTQSDLGIDAGLFKGKVDLTFDWYSKKSNDVLLSLPIPMSTGYFLPADVNIGSIENSGIELSLTYHGGKPSAFNYTIGGNITTVKNQVTDLGSIPEIVTGVGGAQTHRTTVGQPLGYFFGYKTNGIYNTEAEASAGPEDASGKASAGDIRFVDIDGDGKITAADQTKIGSSIPAFYYGINLTANWKRFDLLVFFQGVGKFEVYNQARRNLENMNNGNNQLASVLDRWTPSNTDTNIPRATSGDPNSNNRFSDRWIENGAFTRIKNIQFGYTFANASISKATKELLSGARLYVAIQNLKTFTKYRGYDPEVTRGASFQKGEFALANGQDSGGSPQPRIVQFGVQLQF